MKSLKCQFAALLLLPALLGAGCDNKEISQEQSKLELADVTGDLDQQFLSLRRLEELGQKSSSPRLQQLTSALKLREEMRVAVSDHDHELAVLAADKFLRIAPNHKEGVKVLRESGQIFWLLGQAQVQLADVKDAFSSVETFDKSEPAGLSETETKVWKNKRLQDGLKELDHAPTDQPGLYGPSTKKMVDAALKDGSSKLSVDHLLSEIAAKVDTRRREQADLAIEALQLRAITRAGELVAKARQIDPQFKGAIQLEELLDQAQSSFVASGAQRIFANSRLVFEIASLSHGMIIDTLNSAARSGYGNVQTAWSSIEARTQDAKKGFQKIHANSIARGRMLQAVRIGSAKSLAEQAQAFAQLVETAIEKLLEPSGSLVDFRRAGVEMRADFISRKGALDALIPKSSDRDKFKAAAEKACDYLIFRDASTRKIIEKNAKLFEI